LREGRREGRAGKTLLTVLLDRRSPILIDPFTGLRKEEEGVPQFLHPGAGIGRVARGGEGKGIAGFVEAVVNECCGMHCRFKCHEELFDVMT